MIYVFLNISSFSPRSQCLHCFVLVLLAPRASSSILHNISYGRASQSVGIQRNSRKAKIMGATFTIISNVGPCTVCIVFAPMEHNKFCRSGQFAQIEAQAEHGKEPQRREEAFQIEFRQIVCLRLAIASLKKLLNYPNVFNVQIVCREKRPPLDE